MQHQVRNYLLFQLAILLFIPTLSAQTFTQESLNSLREVVHQFEASNMPDPVSSSGALMNLPCMSEAQRLLQVHYEKMKTFPRTAVYASGKGNAINPGFLEMMKKVDEKIQSLTNQIGSFNGDMTAPGVYVYSAFEVSADYGQFVSNFTGKDVGEFPETVRNDLREVYDTLQPLKRGKEGQGAFNYMTIYYGSDNIEGCRGTESGRLFFKQIDYPQIVWEIQHTYILTCNCESPSGDKVRRMNVVITADVFSNLSGQSMTNLQFQRAGQPRVELTDLVCCGNASIPSQPAAASTQRRQNTNTTPTNTFDNLYLGDTSSLGGLGSGIQYENMIGGKAGFGYRKGGEYSLCAGAQFLAPIGDPLCNNGSGQIIAGAEAYVDYQNSGDDFATQTETRFGFAPKAMITKTLGPNVDLITGVRVPIEIGSSKYKFEDSTSPSEESNTDIFSYGGDLFSGFSFVICKGIILQATTNVFEYRNTTITPNGNSDFKTEETDWRFMFNKRNMFDVYLNFPF